MASLRKYPRSPYWFACFTLSDGRRVQRSTKETTRKKAQIEADKWEALAKGKAKAAHMQKVVADIYKAAHGENLPSSTAQTFLDSWLARRKGEVKEATFTAYSARVKGFISFLGKAVNEPLGNVTQKDIQRYRDEIASRLSSGTANQTVKILRSILEDARRDGFIADNPAKDVRALKVLQKKEQRRPFTLDEIKAILKVADEEWRSMIYFALYTGQRLADLAQLNWSNLDLTSNELRFVSGKTGRQMCIPLCSPLLSHILKLPTPSKNPTAPLHPRAITHVSSGGVASGLSRQFGEILALAGMRPPTTHEASKDGRKAKRIPSSTSFHSLRHSATSLLKNAGVSPAVVQDIIGHDSAEMSAHYTVIEGDTKRRALEFLPDVTTS